MQKNPKQTLIFGASHSVFFSVDESSVNKRTILYKYL